MPNTIKERPLDPIMSELQRMGATPNGPLWEFVRFVVQATDKTINQKGEIQSKANVTGRSEPLSLTLNNITAIGQLANADAIAADGATFGRVNITALTANNIDLSKSGVTNKTAANIAETSNLKWRSTAHSAANPTNIVITGTDSGGGHAQISYPTFILRVPTSDGSFVDVSYPIGLVTGLNNSTTYYMFLDDATFSGSASLVVTTDPNALFNSGSRIYIGSCTTPAGGAGNTTGKPGGMGGGVNRGTVLN